MVYSKDLLNELFIDSFYDKNGFYAYLHRWNDACSYLNRKWSIWTQNSFLLLFSVKILNRIKTVGKLLIFTWKKLHKVIGINDDIITIVGSWIWVYQGGVFTRCPLLTPRKKIDLKPLDRCKRPINFFRFLERESLPTPLVEESSLKVSHRESIIVVSGRRRIYLVPVLLTLVINLICHKA